MRPRPYGRGYKIGNEIRERGEAFLILLGFFPGAYHGTCATKAS